ncbi:protein tyrosine phosphatase receptor type B [Clonorchis sinensis]|nr:protein tyrosine phosphatase receptor type B [Clonorchis sinensis]
MAFFVALATGAIIIVLLGIISPLPETEQVTVSKPKPEKKEREKSVRKSKRQKERSESIRMTRTQGHHVARIGKTPDELRAYLDDCLEPSNRHLHQEYSALRKDCLKREISENLTTNYATDPKNHALNRYPDIIPYDQTVVLLGGGGIPEEKVAYYINASYIYAVTPCKDAYTAPQLNRTKVEYIAAQGPLKKTVVDFWEMIAEKRISIIVMLTQLVERNVPKCAAYWPDEVNATVIHMCHGKELAVTLISEEDCPSYVIRKFNLVSGTDESEPAVVTQLHMKLWPDHGVPDLAEFAAVLNEYQTLKMSDVNKDAPTLVHCSAGVGRTGIFIAADIIKRQMDSDVEWFDIHGTVSQLRFCRMHMVQKVDQYVFLHQFVRSLLDEKPQS